MQAEARPPAAISSLPPAVPEFHTRPAPQCLGVLAGHAPRTRRAAAGPAAPAAGGATPGGTWPRSAPRPPTRPRKPACLRCGGVWGRQAVGEMSQRCTSEYASPSGRSVSGRQPSGHAFLSYPCTPPPLTRQHVQQLLGAAHRHNVHAPAHGAAEVQCSTDGSQTDALPARCWPRCSLSTLCLPCPALADRHAHATAWLHMWRTSACPRLPGSRGRPAQRQTHRPVAGWRHGVGAAWSAG